MEAELHPVQDQILKVAEEVEFHFLRSTAHSCRICSRTPSFRMCNKRRDRWVDGSYICKAHLSVIGMDIEQHPDYADRCFRLVDTYEEHWVNV